MKRTALMVVLLYAAIFLILSYVVPMLSFLGTSTKVETLSFWKEASFWIWIALYLLCQLALLTIPVKAEERRPVAKRAVILPILASAFMMGLLVLGVVASIGELLTWEFGNLVWWIAWIEAGLTWLLWALIFWRWTRSTEPRGLVDKMTRTMYRGSLLELLIAVPVHIIVRQRPYCCAGAATSISISIGMAVMVFAFGPALFFLFAERARRKNIAKRE